MVAVSLSRELPAFPMYWYRFSGHLDLMVMKPMEFHVRYTYCAVFVTVRAVFRNKYI